MILPEEDSYWSQLRSRGVAAAADALTEAEVVALTERYGTHNYHPLPVSLVRARGAWAYDAAGKGYLDCIGAYSAVAHGHLPEYLVETMREQLERVTLTSRAVYTPQLALFLQAL